MGHEELFLKKLKNYENDPEYILHSLLFEINEEICKALKKNNLNNKQFAERLSVKPAYVSKLLNGQPNLSIKSLIKIAVALNLKLRQPFYEEREQNHAIFLSCMDVKNEPASPDYQNVNYHKHEIEAPNESNTALAA
jgi:transcriptional regulator with XRE-family HTH domain